VALQAQRGLFAIQALRWLYLERAGAVGAAAGVPERPVRLGGWAGGRGAVDESRVAQAVWGAWGWRWGMAWGRVWSQVGRPLPPWRATMIGDKSAPHMTNPAPHSGARTRSAP